MNTPSPCNKCRHQYYNVMYEDEPTNPSWCWYEDFPVSIKPLWGDENCPLFEPEEVVK